MSLTIYHNPRCSKSRQTLDLMIQNGVEPKIVHYLEQAPEASTIEQLAHLLGSPVAALLRTGEAEYKEAADLPDPNDNAALAAWLADHPRVLERPIVVDSESGSAVIGRPPENVLKLLPK